MGQSRSSCDHKGDPADDLILATFNPEMATSYFYAGTICPHGHRLRNKKYHWCHKCVQKIVTHGCGADINKACKERRWEIWHFFHDLPVDLDKDKCWILPDKLQYAPENNPRKKFVGYKDYFRGAHHHVPLARIIYWWFWGDIGSLPVKRICNNPYCWNPLHLRSRFNIQPVTNKIEPFNTEFDVWESNAYWDEKLGLKPITLSLEKSPAIE